MPLPCQCFLLNLKSFFLIWDSFWPGSREENLKKSYPRIPPGKSAVQPFFTKRTPFFTATDNSSSVFICCQLVSKSDSMIPLRKQMIFCRYPIFCQSLNKTYGIIRKNCRILHGMPDKGFRCVSAYLILQRHLIPQFLIPVSQQVSEAFLVPLFP